MVKLNETMIATLTKIKHLFSDVLNQRQRELGAEEALGIGPGEHVIAREDVVSMDDRAAHDAMKARLMVQFNQALKKGEVYWPKRSGGVRLYVPSI